MANKEKKYWLRPELLVQHKNGLVVKVDRLDIRRIKTETGQKDILMGVYCSWTDKNGDPQSRKFHSQELSPIEDNE